MIEDCLGTRFFGRRLRIISWVLFATLIVGVYTYMVSGLVEVLTLTAIVLCAVLLSWVLIGINQLLLNQKERDL